jgi:ABC-type uncharacterized transport system substrate-binding protein
MSDIQEAETMAKQAVKLEKQLAIAEKQFAVENKQFAAFLKKQADTNKKIADMWNRVKAALIEANYFDVIENDNFKISVSKVLGIKVADVDKLPEEYTEIVRTAKLDKIKKHYELYGELPAGTVDSSYYRLNKKVK